MKKSIRPADGKFQTAVKVIMSLVFAWSGFFWSGVTALQFFINNTSHKNLAVGFFTASLVLLLGLVLCWARLYILQVIPSIVGIIMFLSPAREMIDHAADTGVIFKPSFEVRYLPVIAFGILSLVLFAVRVYGIISARNERREEFNNLPSESVLEKHHEE